MDGVRRAAAPLLGAALGLALLLTAGDLDQVARPGQLGPGFWPRLVLLGLVGACALKAITDWRRRPAPRPGRDGEPGAPPAPAGGPAVPGAGQPAPPGGGLAWPTLAGAAAAIVLYVLLTPWIGFALATALFVAAFMRLAGARSLPVVAAHAVAGTIGLLYAFVKLVYLPLPKGAGAFESLTLALYRALRIF